MVSRTDAYGYTVSYGYDLAGNLTRLTYPSGVEVLYEYDGLNRLKAVCDWNCDPDQCKPADRSDCTVAYTYDVAGNLTSARLPDGATVDYSYDAARRLTGVDDSLGTQTYYRAHYALNAAGKRIAADLELPLEPDPDTGRTDFAYDAANTLTDRSGAAGTASYEYDADGNLLTGTLGGSPRTMTYNALGQLETLDGNVVHRHDADGLRVETSRGDIVHRRVYDPGAKYPQLLEERDGQGNLIARYIYGLGLVARDGPEGPRIYHYDSRGSTVALTNDYGTVTDRYAYGPYGQLLASVADVDLDGDGTPDPTENPFTYVGRDGVQDDGNGLYYMRARYYAPELGRFIQKDQVFDGTLTAPQSLNRYAYVQGDPVLFTDPDGDFLVSLLVGIVICAVVATVVNNVAECTDDDGCDVDDVFGVALESFVEAIPFVGTLYQGISGAITGQMNWASFGMSVAGDALTLVGAGAGKVAAKASAKAWTAAAKAASGGKYAKLYANTGSRLGKAGKELTQIGKSLAKDARAAGRAATAWRVAGALPVGATVAEYGFHGGEIYYGYVGRMNSPTPTWIWDPAHPWNPNYCGSKCEEEEP
jgi:RHS repeat-associated protein